MKSMLMNMENNGNLQSEKPEMVENVQEMVRRDPSCIPERYIIKNHDDRPKIAPVALDIPVVDLSLLSQGNEDELKRLDLACTDWGFFQVINHGVAEEVLHRMKNTISSFFELPFEEKNKYAMMSPNIYGQAQSFVPVMNEELKLDWGDALLFKNLSGLEKREYWPPGLKDAIEAYSAEVKTVSKRLLCALSLTMGMDKESLQGMHKDGLEILRVNYYPTCCMPDLVLGVSPHSDVGSVTILTQDDETTGLQIRHGEGWVSVKPIPNAFLVNIGDSIEIWSNGKYQSIEHRAVTNKYKPRISIASFTLPSYDMELEPLDHMVDLLNPQKMYKKIKFGDYLMAYVMKKLDGKAHTKLAKVEFQ
ncbi:Dmr6-like oxygenase [Thalictrum thalictroides]|uniref:Dmr6-like oxygenase n=1 Tax=Thalictrum thalictroides TaxID=46969 RepID=A0A7J6VQ39_THATH|nr:Dmr6-like oxygenase [Thalictrum thalictroides]